MMTLTEQAGTVAAINMFWPRDQLSGETASAWGATLARFDRAIVTAALHTLAASHKWRPSLAEIIAECKPLAAEETALEAFQAVRQCMSLPAPRRRDAISAKAYQAVQRIGGWAYVGTWQLDQMHHHQRLFCEAFGDVEARYADNERLGLPAPGSEPSKALSGIVAKALGGRGGNRPDEPTATPEPPDSDEHEPTVDERLKVAEAAADFLERLKRE